MVMLDLELKGEINAQVIKGCPFNGAELVAARMEVVDWVITLPKLVYDGNRFFRTDNIFIENFRGDSYDVQQRKAELQKTVPPVGRIKYFSAERAAWRRCTAAPF
jgi:hypothetical protein